MATSETTKRKHVEREVLSISDSILPDAQRGLEVVRVWASRGNNLHEVERNDGTRCQCPTSSGSAFGLNGVQTYSMFLFLLLVLYRSLLFIFFH